MTTIVAVIGAFVAFVAKKVLGKSPDPEAAIPIAVFEFVQVTVVP